MFAGTAFGPTPFFLAFAADCTARCFAPAAPPPGRITISASFALTGSTIITPGASHIDVTAIAQLGNKIVQLQLPVFTTTTAPTIYPISVSGVVAADGTGMPLFGIGASLSVNVFADTGTLAQANFAHTFKLTNLELPTGYVLVDANGEIVDHKTLVAAVPLPAAVWLIGSALGGLRFARRRSS